ncbi:hypothetical protein PPERSA_10103 [Pseudocohnilembus persalinus]|uniref:HD domain-containing protein n=1 Tax=Pseudocohnilembus persalinus TaxID=266149 RepID=A0A0V0R9P3_PSEPJ|nr:hypothetical protein PPERSA_10103 [Pseudocohnilembus persalinus]|eukprot:KRX11171.1 hypothetical protein PPERSA_10103 [Pseudocohnilembus persalinus]
MQQENKDFDHEVVIEQTKKFVEQHLQGAESGHAYDHIERVYKLAKTIAKKTENPGNLLVIELGALVHDVYDHKFCDEEDKGPRVIQEFLQNLNVPQEVIDKVIQIMKKISYSKSKTTQLEFIEGLIVQDADRLDAIGAIGIARTFSYGGYKGRQFYNPQELKQVDTEKEPIKNGATITHFYEKLLLLKDKLNTQAAREIAQERHEFMETFLARFYREWEGEC